MPENEEPRDVVSGAGFKGRRRKRLTDAMCSMDPPAGQPPIGDFVTVVTAIQGAGYLTKIWQDPLGETVDPAAEVGLFHYDHVRVANLDGLAELLNRLGDMPRSAIIRGILKPDLPAFVPHPRRSRGGDGVATVDDVPRFWCGVDLDDLDVAPWLTPEQIASFARGLLPFPFSAAPCVWQLSASSGSAKKRSKGHAGVHLWFWLAEPRTSADLRHYFRQYPRVDRSLFKAVGLHFTADPILPAGAADPYAGQRIGMLSGFAVPAIPELPATAKTGGSVPLIGMGGGGDPVAIERLIKTLERSGALRSKSGTVRREARLALLDVLVNDLGFVGTEDDLHDIFMRVCVGAGDEDGETDFLEAMAWAENPNADRIGVGSLLIEAEGAALARNDAALLHEIRLIKNARHAETQPTGSAMIAAAMAAGVVPSGLVMTEGNAQARESSPGAAADDDEEGAEPEDGSGAGNAGADGTDSEDLDLVAFEDPENERFETWQEAGNGQRVRVPVLACAGNGEIALKGEINTRRMLKYLRVEVRWNAWLAERQVRREPDMQWRKMTDADWDRALTDAHNPAFRFPVQTGDFERALRSIAERHAVDPMTQAFRELLDRPAESVSGHDEGLDLESWLPAVCGIEDSAYHRAVGRYMVGAMVRRILLPGCKSDEMAVLISKVQGKGKSTLCRLLAPTIDGRETFTDALALGADPKEVLEQTGGIAIVEFSELAGSRGKEIEHIKAMVSRTEDTARPAYGRETVTRKRRFICIGTSNDETPLRDESGNRRFLPVRLRDDLDIDLERLGKVREWLWRLAAAELVASGMQETFRLPRELWDEAAERQAAALGRTAGEELLRDMFGEPEAGTEWVMSKDVSLWRNKHGKMPDQSFSGAMKRLGFVNTLVRDGGKPVRRWVRDTEGLEGSGRFVLNDTKGTFERVPMTNLSGAMAEFKPNG